jgi:hypothetical protein
MNGKRHRSFGRGRRLDLRQSPPAQISGTRGVRIDAGQVSGMSKKTEAAPTMGGLILVKIHRVVPTWERSNSNVAIS